MLHHRFTVVASAAFAVGVIAMPLNAADHADTPFITADPAADIADVYLWRPNPAESKIVLGMTFGGRSAATAGGVRIDGPTMFCDRDVLYILNIDNNADGNLDATPDIRIFARLARDENGQCGFQVENIPGVGGRVLSGREGQITVDNTTGLRAFAGLVEDPFFFDTVGFSGSPPGSTSLITSINTDPPQDTSPLLIRNTVDGFAGRNISGIIFEMDLDSVTGGRPSANPTIQVWGETRRFAGTAP